MLFKHFVQLSEGYIRIEKSKNNLTVADGEAGKGIYFSLSKYPNMVHYYKQGTEEGFRIIKAVPKPSTKIIDLTSSAVLANLLSFMDHEVNELFKRISGIKPKINKTNYQIYGRLIEKFIQQYYPSADAYIVNHQGHNKNHPQF